MGLSVAVRSMKEAVRILKREMNYPGPEWEGVREAGRKAMRTVIEEHMEGHVRTYLAELAELGIPDRRNGSYRRTIASSLGTMELSVPRTRTFSAVAVAQEYARRHREVDRSILACFALGLSTRKVGEALLPILGERVSPSTVSRIAKTLDAAVADFHQRLLPGRYRLLVLDGVVLSRKTGAGAVRRPVLVAMGVRHDGKKEILDFRMATSESQAAWETFLTDLERRGLKAEHIEILVADGGSGLHAARETVFPNVPLQRCWAHKTRNVLDKVRKIDRERVKQDLQRIYQAKNRVRARAAARRFTDRWEEISPNAVRCLRNDLDELLVFFRFEDPAGRKAARTTNAIERRFREVRRRTRPMGVFSDRTSIERILYAVFTRENWKQGSGTPFLLTQKT